MCCARTMFRSLPLHGEDWLWGAEDHIVPMSSFQCRRRRTIVRFVLAYRVALEKAFSLLLDFHALNHSHCSGIPSAISQTHGTAPLVQQNTR